MPLYALMAVSSFWGRILTCSLLSEHGAEEQGHATEITSLFANSTLHAMLMSIWPRGELGQPCAVCSGGLSPTWLLIRPSLSVLC